MFILLISETGFGGGRRDVTTLANATILGGLSGPGMPSASWGDGPGVTTVFFIGVNVLELERWSQSDIACWLLPLDTFLAFILTDVWHAREYVPGEGRADQPCVTRRVGVTIIGR